MDLDIKKALALGKNIYELPLRVSYYARVSSEHIEQMTSIINQVDYFIEYVNRINNWVLVDGYVDEGISGKETKKRDNFIRMINDGKEGKFDLVLTKSVSRFARNTIDSIKYTGLLLERGVGVYFINDNINTFYSDSEFRLTLMASIAQDELRKLSESVRFGLKQSINRGIVLGSSNILGYCKDKGKLVVVEEEARIVREIFFMFDKGVNNYSEIARVINSRYGSKFNSNSIKRILTNYKYKGYYCGKKSEVIDYKSGKRRLIDSDNWVVYSDKDNVPLIVDESLWDRVNKVIGKKNTYVDVYKNKVFCLIHGIVSSKGKKYKGKYYRYYVCNSCFRVSNGLLDRVVRGKIVKRVVISNNGSKGMRLDIMY